MLVKSYYPASCQWPVAIKPPGWACWNYPPIESSTPPGPAPTVQTTRRQGVVGHWHAGAPHLIKLDQLCPTLGQFFWCIHHTTWLIVIHCFFGIFRPTEVKKPLMRCWATEQKKGCAWQPVSKATLSQISKYDAFTAPAQWLKSDGIWRKRFEPEHTQSVVGWGG